MNLHEGAFESYYGLGSWNNPEFKVQRTAWMRALNQAAASLFQPTEAQARVFHDFIVEASGEEVHHGMLISFDELWRKLVEAKNAR
jgi:hypothetical protein